MLSTTDKMYFDQLADDIEETGMIETAKDMRKLIAMAHLKRNQMIVTTDNKNDIPVIQLALQNAENDGELNFPFEVQRGD